MDINIKNSIDARKTALDMYNDKKIIEKKEELFKRIYELGESSKDITDFETKFQTSTLNTEYINLITEAAMINAQEVNVYNPSIEDIAKQEIRSEVDSALRDTPVGDALQVKQTFDLFNKFRKKDK